MGRHKSINQCQPQALTRALLSTQPLNHTFFLAVKAVTDADLPFSPSKDGKGSLQKIKSSSTAWKKLGLTRPQKRR